MIEMFFLWAFSICLKGFGRNTENTCKEQLLLSFAWHAIRVLMKRKFPFWALLVHHFGEFSYELARFRCNAIHSFIARLLLWCRCVWDLTTLNRYSNDVGIILLVITGSESKYSAEFYEITWGIWLLKGRLRSFFLMRYVLFSVFLSTTSCFSGDPLSFLSICSLIFNAQKMFWPFSFPSLEFSSSMFL